MKLQDKVCIVTGAASGIGREIARTYAREGGKVVVADADLDAAQAVVDEITTAGGIAMAAWMDVTSEVQVNTAVASVVAAYGGVDVLVSNAGHAIAKPGEGLPVADWKAMLAIHLDGAVLTTKACLPYMRNGGKGGSIIYMGSMLDSAYVTARHGLTELCQTVSTEGGPHGIRANVICPGFVRALRVVPQLLDQVQSSGATDADAVNTVTLTEADNSDFTTKEDVAEAALFLAVCGFQAPTGRLIVARPG